MLMQTGGAFSGSIISDSPPVKKPRLKDQPKLRPTAGALRSNPLYASRAPFERAQDANQGVERPGQALDRLAASGHNAAVVHQASNETASNWQSQAASNTINNAALHTFGSNSTPVVDAAKTPQQQT